MRWLVVIPALWVGFLGAFGLRVAYTGCDLAREKSWIDRRIYLEFEKAMRRSGVDVVDMGYLSELVNVRRALENSMVDVVVGSFRFESERVEFSRYPLYSLKVVLLRKRSRFKGTIAVVHNNPVMEKLASTMGYEKILKTGSFKEALILLKRDEIDAVLHYSLILENLDLPPKYEIVKRIPHPRIFKFVAYSRDLPDRIKRIIEEVVEEMVLGGTVEKVVKEMGLDEHVIPANHIKMANIDWPPYEFLEGGEWKGVDVEVLKEVFSRIGFKLEIVNIPWIRIIEHLKIGAIDGTFSLTTTPSRMEFLYFTSEPLSSGLDVLFKREDFELPSNDVKDLEGLRCGYVIGYAYGEEFYYSKLEKIPVRDDRTGMVLLERGRIDLFVVNLLVGRYYAKLLGFEDLVPAVKIGKKKLYYIAFPKTDPFYRFLSDIVSKSLRDFKKTDEYIEILKRYGVEYGDLWEVTSF